MKHFVVSSNTIRMVSNLCTSNDCRFLVEYGGGTLMGHQSPHYNKNGDIIVDDINTRHEFITCQKCKKKWDVFRDYKNVFSIENIT